MRRLAVSFSRAAVYGALLLIVPSVSAIYPSDHWSYATKLTAENFDSEIASQISQGKTTFVRFIASSG